MSSHIYEVVKDFTTSALSRDPRPEIRDILRKEFDISLYLRALTHFQGRPKEEVTSWYQIAGIHGRPYKDWDQVPRISTGDPNRGYCTHASILFPTWHRAWLALFEQTLKTSAQAVFDKIKHDPENDTPAGKAFITKLDEALGRFRMPYWDWAMKLPDKSPIVPEIFRVKKWKVLGPKGTEDIDNPLYSYSFGTINKDDFPAEDYPFSTWLNTVRHCQTPVSVHRDDEKRLPPDPEDQGNPEELLRAFYKNADLPLEADYAPDTNLRSRVYFLYSEANLKDYKYFSNTTYTADTDHSGLPAFDSLEAVHNTAHLRIGGIKAHTGHMSDNGYACFDPIFHLHHTFIDRLCAFWQVLNPDSQMEPQHDANRARTEDKTTGLLPFHKSQEALWNSEGAWDCQTFGSYIELQNSDTKEPLDPEKMLVNVNEAIRVQYAPDSPQHRLLRQDYPTLAKAHGPTREYFATVRVEQQALCRSFNVNIYIGDIETASEKYNNLVGTFSVFTSSSGCERCKENAASGLLVGGTIPLTGALLDKINAGLLSLEPREVGPYLKKNMKWDISVVSGTTIPHVDSLLVGVHSAVVELGELEVEHFDSDGVRTKKEQTHAVPKAFPDYSHWEEVHEPQKSPSVNSG